MKRILYEVFFGYIEHSNLDQFLYHLCHHGLPGFSGLFNKHPYPRKLRLDENRLYTEWCVNWAFHYWEIKFLINKKESIGELEKRLQQLRELLERKNIHVLSEQDYNIEEGYAPAPLDSGDILKLILAGQVPEETKVFRYISKESTIYFNLEHRCPACLFHDDVNVLKAFVSSVRKLYGQEVKVKIVILTFYKEKRVVNHDNWSCGSVVEVDGVEWVFSN